MVVKGFLSFEASLVLLLIILEVSTRLCQEIKNADFQPGSNYLQKEQGFYYGELTAVVSLDTVALPEFKQYLKQIAKTSKDVAPATGQQDQVFSPPLFQSPSNCQKRPYLVSCGALWTAKKAIFCSCGAARLKA